MNSIGGRKSEYNVVSSFDFIFYICLTLIIRCPFIHILASPKSGITISGAPQFNWQIPPFISHKILMHLSIDYVGKISKYYHGRTTTLGQVKKQKPVAEWYSKYVAVHTLGTTYFRNMHFKILNVLALHF